MIADTATRVEDFVLPKTKTNRYKASFLPSALSSFNLVCACVKTSAEDDDFQSLSKGDRQRDRERG